MLSQKLLPALALLGVAAAQSSLCSVSTATITINSQADATAIADCTTVAGSILIGPEASGTLSLDGPDAIAGSLICKSAGGLTSLTSNSIGTIATSKTGSPQFNLFNLTLLTTLSFTKLQEVGDIEWSSLTALSQLTFPSFISKANSVVITDTFLSTLDGINLDQVGLLDINNNKRLQSFSTQVSTISSGLNIASNGQSLIVSFPNLIWANNMTFRNVSSVSIPSLATVNGSLILDENYFTSISAPNLTDVGMVGNGSLAFVANPQLTNITIPNIKYIGGGVQVANNSALQTISFPVLATVGGAVDLSGNFTTPNLPSLNNVVGALNIQSTAQIDCSGFNKLSGGIVQGHENCVSATNDPSTLSPSGTVTGGGSGTGGTSKPSGSKGAAVSYGVSEAVAGLSVVGGIMQMLL